MAGQRDQVLVPDLIIIFDDDPFFRDIVVVLGIGISLVDGFYDFIKFDLHVSFLSVGNDVLSDLTPDLIILHSSAFSDQVKYNKGMETILFSKMDKQDIINLLMNGGILAFPTDTVFGLASIAEEEAIDRIYEAKGRSFDKALPMMCDSLKMVKKFACVNRNAEKIIRRFTPGALTLVMKKKESLSEKITKGKDTIAIRIPDDEFILDLIRQMKKPLMVTQINLGK